jgi:hypothetical protein
VPVVGRPAPGAECDLHCDRTSAFAKPLNEPIAGSVRHLPPTLPRPPPAADFRCEITGKHSPSSPSLGDVIPYAWIFAPSKSLKPLAQLEQFSV